ncbi:reverse transcriptase domain-containing protein [Tanacetum coccineum]
MRNLKRKLFNLKLGTTNLNPNAIIYKIQSVKSLHCSKRDLRVCFLVTSSLAITTQIGVTLAGPSVPPPIPPTPLEVVERGPKITMDQVHISSSESIAHVPPLSCKCLGPDAEICKMLKELLTNKEKLLELANTPLNENCSVVLLNKLLEKLGDPGKFLIPCYFKELEVCMSLADLGGSINPMPLFVYQKLKLGKLKPTRMSLELANRSVTYPVGIAEDVFVQVDKFTFPADFVVVDYDIDPHVLLILGRPFLMTAKALVDVHGEELTLRIGDEKLTFNVENASNYPHEHDDESINKIDIC